MLVCSLPLPAPTRLSAELNWGHTARTLCVRLLSQACLQRLPAAGPILGRRLLIPVELMAVHLTLAAARSPVKHSDGSLLK